MYNTGQSCCSVERVYVHEKIYDKFVDAFVNTVKTFKAGDPMSEDTYIGAITGRHSWRCWTPGCRCQSQRRQAIDRWRPWRQRRRLVPAYRVFQRQPAWA